MPDQHTIYAQHADQYEALVAREDYEGNILRALQAICPLEGLEVVELGAGTGRLTCLLTPIVKHIHALDASQHMLDIAQAKLNFSSRRNWKIQVADHRRLPCEDACADMVISGWSVCYTVVDYPQAGRAELDRALSEMRRVLRPGGTIVILETLGTGYATPCPPESLHAYYDYLAESGFEHTWIRTDYRFESLEEAERLTRFFFGEALAEQVVRENWVILPECTGVWQRRRPEVSHE